MTPQETERGGASSGNIKATREDWTNAALETLIVDGIERVKILSLAAQLNVSRSSFYWYFTSRNDLLEALLDHWHETNTAAIVTAAQRPVPTITSAVCQIFECFLDPALFNNRLDFAIRDWSRRDENVRRKLLASDAERIKALTEMFVRYGYAPTEALIRARVLYYMQIGYFDAGLDEPISQRQSFTADYVLTFTGQRPTAAEIAQLDAALARIFPDASA